MKIECKYCGRYIAETKGTFIAQGIICGNSKCKAKLNIKIVTPSSSEEDIRFKFSTPEVPPKKQSADVPPYGDTQ